MATLITVKQREAKTLRFTCISAGAAVDLSTATLAFMVKGSKSDLDASAKISKSDADFGKTLASTGIVTLPLSSIDLNQTPGRYYAELKITFDATNIDKSADMIFVIEQSVIAA
jgi:hypothetical protein